MGPNSFFNRTTAQLSNNVQRTTYLSFQVPARGDCLGWLLLQQLQQSLLWSLRVIRCRGRRREITCTFWFRSIIRLWSRNDFECCLLEDPVHHIETTSTTFQYATYKRVIVIFPLVLFRWNKVVWQRLGEKFHKSDVIRWALGTIIFALFIGNN